jgi:hypothetical protein|tara:strand:+ start:796 stop:954 length:159 start_codon:yes stop_codon:yes gene_type:complete
MTKVKGYFIKFGMKMRGSTESTAKGWVEGTGTMLSSDEKKTLWKKIQNRYYR